MTDVFECPGASNIKAPTIEEIKCPKCQEDLEIFTDEKEITCDRCGAKVDRKANLQCIQWCEAAEKCIGEEKYKELMGDKNNDR